MDISEETMKEVLDDCIFESINSSVILRKTFYEIFYHIIEEKQKYIDVKILWVKMNCKFNYPYYHQQLERFVMWGLLNKIKIPNSNKKKYIMVQTDKWKKIKEDLEK